VRNLGDRHTIIGGLLLLLLRYRQHSDQPANDEHDQRSNLRRAVPDNPA
jgi:hypothetical protein